MTSSFERALQLTFQAGAQTGNLFLMFSIFLQHQNRVAVRGIHRAGVLDIQVVVAGFDLFDGHAPGILVFDSLIPPRFFQIKFLDVDRARLRIVLAVGGRGMLKIPDLLRRLAFGEEQQVGIDARVRIEHAFGQAHDGMQVARRQANALSGAS